MAALVVAAAVHDEPTVAREAAPVRARAVPGTVPASGLPPPGAENTEDHEQAQLRRRVLAVERLLAARASALRARDRDAFLAPVDPGSPALRSRESRSFDALGQVPLGTWTYSVDGSSSPTDARLDSRYGRDQWWAPKVTLSYALDGFDERPVVVDLHLTFTLRDGRWFLAADDDFVLQGRATPRAFWDHGPVVAVRARGVLVLGRPGAEALLQEVAAVTAAAVPRVTAAWGPWTERVVVLVPRDAAELASLLGGERDLSQIAAVATAELHGGRGSYDPTGNRVLVNPDTFEGLGQLASRVVLTHEVTHVATRAATGPAVPAWLAEGFADHVAYRDEVLPVRAVAQRLGEQVRAGQVPAALPPDQDFEGGSPRLTEAYESSWLAVRMLAGQHGDAGLLRLYRAVGAARDVTAEQALESALRRELGTTSAQLTADWRGTLVQQLG